MGGSTENMGWKPSEWHGRKNITNNSHDKLTKFNANIIINHNP